MDHKENIKDSTNHVWVSKELRELVKKKLRSGKGKQTFFDHYLYFCSIVGHLAHNDRRYKDCDFVPIHYKTMASIISRKKYTEIFTNLQNWDVIEGDNSYSVGNKSKGYRLRHPYNQKFQQYPIKDSLINDKLNNNRKKRIQEIAKMPLQHQYLHMTNTWIKMDCVSAYLFNEANYLVLLDPKSSTPHPKTVYDTNSYAIRKFENEEYWFTEDDSGRIHTNITSLHTHLRRFLFVNGKPLGQVDIKNSQPMFFYLHIKDIETIPQTEKDDYRTLVESGYFYEFFMEKLGIDLKERKKVKQPILVALFSDKMRSTESRYMKVFRTKYPSIADYIMDMRRENYKQLIIILQRAESKFIFEKVVAAFVAKYGEQLEFISTIHDSIVVTTDMLFEAEKIMRECFQQEGINAKLSLSRFEEKTKIQHRNKDESRTISPLMCTPTRRVYTSVSAAIT
jgi:hypothetical protein